MTIGEGIFYSVLLIFCALPAGVCLIVAFLNWDEIIQEAYAKKRREHAEQAKRIKENLK